MNGKKERGVVEEWNRFQEGIFEDAKESSGNLGPY